MDTQNLRSKITDAFSSVPHPGELNITGHQCEECFELRDIFSPLKWDAVPPEIIDANYGELPLFTHEAFRYFLPAYLLRCLDDFDPDSMVCEFVVYSLDPEDAGENQKEWIAGRHNMFGRKQKEAIASFLEYVLATEAFKDFHAEAADGLRRYWADHSENAI